MFALPQKADIPLGGKSQHVPQHGELTEALDFAVARPWAKIIEMSACGALNAPAVAR